MDLTQDFLCTTKMLTSVTDFEKKVMRLLFSHLFQLRIMQDVTAGKNYGFFYGTLKVLFAIYSGSINCRYWQLIKLRFDFKMVSKHFFEGLRIGLQNFALG